MMPTDDGGLIPAIYGEFVVLFSKATAETLPPHRSTNHAINVELSDTFQYGWIYNLSELGLRMFKTYIEAILANGFIQHLSWPAAAPILCGKKKDCGLRLSVD